MDVDKVIRAINSNLRREILKILSKEPMTVSDVLVQLKKSGLQIKYRETVYRSLEKLFEAGLVQKYYVRTKGICYKVLVTNLTIDLVRGIISDKSILQEVDREDV